MTFLGRGKLVGIVDYQAGNIQSIENAITHLDARVKRVRKPGDLAGCSHLVLPGVGAFGFCAQQLAASGMIDSLHRSVFDEHRPLLGICVGMQLLADRSEESPEAAGLGWIGGLIDRIPATAGVRVPHVGWNTVTFAQGYGEFASGASADFYFDHSFAYIDPTTGTGLAHCRHGLKFCAVIQRENLIAAQFHPEKSQAAGMRFLRSFLAS